MKKFKKIHGIRTQYLNEIERIKRIFKRCSTNKGLCFQLNSSSANSQYLSPKSLTILWKSTRVPHFNKKQRLQLAVDSSAPTISMERSAQKRRTTNADVGVEALFAKATNTLSATIEDIHSSFEM
ncbi:hypothetical protein CBL_20129 [Carabus blaptoides fortunei]